MSVGDLGQFILLKWLWLAQYPPFQYVDWMCQGISAAPKWYKAWLCWTLGNMLARKLVPGWQAALVVGTWLKALQWVAKERFANAVSGRLRELLVKQATLQAQQLNLPPAPLPPAALDAAVQRAKEDTALIDVMGSAPGLFVWHRLEKTPLDSPLLLEGMHPNSAALWMIEQLRDNYLPFVKQFSMRDTLDSVAAKAGSGLQALSQAVDSAAIASRSGYAGGKQALEDVEKASKEAAAAIEAVAVARLEWPGVGLDRAAWDEKLTELETTYADKPLVLRELKRLRAA